MLLNSCLLAAFVLLVGLIFMAFVTTDEGSRSETENKDKSLTREGI